MSCSMHNEMTRKAPLECFHQNSTHLFCRPFIPSFSTITTPDCADQRDPSQVDKSSGYDSLMHEEQASSNGVPEREGEGEGEEYGM